MKKFLRFSLYGLIGTLLLLFIAAGAILYISLERNECFPRYINPHSYSRLQQHVETLCSSPRYGESKLQARDYICSTLRDCGWQVELQYFTTADGEQHCNISALRQGNSPARYIIGAHYDACDTDCGNPGADDNASAVAILLELARALPHTRPEYTIELVAWDCEEPPYYDTEDMGSAQHASQCSAQNVRGLVCLEMLGYFSSETDSQPEIFPGHSLLLPTKGDFLAIVGDWNALELGRSAFRHLSKELPTVRLNIPFSHDTALYLSDHRNYAPLGIPSIMLTDTAMLRNPNYHEPTDTPDTLNYNYMDHALTGLTALITYLAGF